MAGRLAGKRAFVTAAGNGIGRASALAMAREGARVLATDIDAAALESLKAEAPGLETLRLDVLDDAAIGAAVAEAQPDILFNCAGHVHHGTVLDCTDADWDFAFALNVRAMWKTMAAAIPGMLERGGGSIINMSSAVSSVIGAPDRFVYGATKAAVIGMTKSVAKDYVTRGIRCNCICPGTVDSPSWRQRVRELGERIGSYEEALARFVSRQPMGRVARAEEIAWLVVYLASDESAFTTGQAHVIDGGWSG